MLYIRTKEHKKAIKSFRQAQLQAPNSFFGKAAVVYISIIKEDFKTARAMMDDLASFDTPDGEVWYYWSANYAVLGDQKNSIRLLKKAIDYGYFNYPTMSQDPFYDSIKENKEFKQQMMRAKRKHLDFKRKHS